MVSFHRRAFSLSASLEDQSTIVVGLFRMVWGKQAGAEMTKAALFSSVCY